MVLSKVVRDASDKGSRPHRCPIGAKTEAHLFPAPNCVGATFRPLRLFKNNDQSYMSTMLYYSHARLQLAISPANAPNRQCVLRNNHIRGLQIKVNLMKAYMSKDSATSEESATKDRRRSQSIRVSVTWVTHDSRDTNRRRCQHTFPTAPTEKRIADHRIQRVQD